MRRFRAVVSIAAALVLGRELAPAFPSPVTEAPRAIGFRVVEQVDAARTSSRFPKGRPVQVSFWYPAGGSGRPITLKDYVLLAATETSRAPATPAAEQEALARYRAYMGRAKLTHSQVDAILGTKMRALRDAAAGPGTFPLVMIAQGNGESAYDQAFLAEMLAGRGYAVGTTPSQARISTPMKSQAEIPAQALDQAADIRVAAEALRRESSVRPGNLGLVGYSFGARSALLYEIQHRDVAALASLDGGIGSKIGRGMLERAAGFNPKRVEAPLLHFYEEEDRYVPVDLDLIRSFDRSDRWLVKVQGMRHVHFSTTGILVRTNPPLAAITSASEKTAGAWDAVAAATIAFLDRFLTSPRPDEPPAAWMPPRSSYYTVQELPGFARAPRAPRAR
jgi:dienelactone hydrolase